MHPQLGSVLPGGAAVEFPAGPAARTVQACEGFRPRTRTLTGIPTGGMGALGMDTACDICGGNPRVCEEETRAGVQYAAPGDER